jgi:hypothetical protein
MNTPTRYLAFALFAAFAMPSQANARSIHAYANTDDRAANELARHAVGPLRGGVVDRLRIDPHGTVSGVLLRDGTELVATGAGAQQLATIVRPGDHIRAPYGPNDTVRIEDARTGRFVQLGGIAAVARGGGPASQWPDFGYAPVDDASRLGPIAVSGRVRSMLHLPDGAASGFVMEDGTQVHVLNRVAFAMSKMISPGDSVVVEGRGTRTPIGTGLWAVKLTQPGGPLMLDITRGIGAPELNLP